MIEEELVCGRCYTLACIDELSIDDPDAAKEWAAEITRDDADYWQDHADCLW